MGRSSLKVVLADSSEVHALYCNDGLSSTVNCNLMYGRSLDIKHWRCFEAELANNGEKGVLGKEQGGVLAEASMLHWPS